MVAPRKLNALGVAGASELFQLLRDGRPRTRAELAEITGMARSTIGLRLDTLLDLNLIGPIGEGVSSGGRPPSQFALNQSARVVVGADLGASHATLAVTDLGGTILGTLRTAMPIADGPERVLSWFADATRTLLADLGRSPSDLLAVGMGLPGPVEHSTGRPVNPPIMPGWDGFDVPAWVRETLGVPALVDNDVNIMAIGERTHAFPDTRDLLFVKVATGIGSGIISGGLLQRGAQGSAGDIGHVPIQRGAGVACHCGNFGCLEAMASGPAIARQLRQTGATTDSMRDVIDLVRAGDLNAIRAVRQAGRDIGEVLTMCVSMVNPSVIVLGGSVSAAGEQLLAGVREVVYQRSTPLATHHLSIVQSQAAENAAVLGASMLALDFALSPEAIGSMNASA
ncbi:ROK family transcriptional regulator [Glaciihabitans sp. dw_435]|uniref:ROK family transcriptional regulator n=1 Tax=Glaciihabitans sp. dw_435 TaxID=2720081 RepID=UPI001BD2F4C1|nr:ROK family transcriptional regulator [Glaciihabitans sp. dw_435]